MVGRRQFLMLPLAAAAAPAGPVIDTHIHLFDPAAFPYHPRATYKPEASPLEPYLAFAKQAGITHTVIVHPEPYQDDHRYLEHCFAHESPAKLFKGTCLFDPVDGRTPVRMREIARQFPGRIVAMRIHAMNGPGEAPLATGPIKNRDLRDPRIKDVFREAGRLGMSIQMHFLPHHSPEIGALAAEFKDVPVILDHMGRAGMGGAEGFEQVLRLADHPLTFFKFSGVRYSSKQDPPHKDVQGFVKRAFDSFGSERILWGGLGHNMTENKAARELFEFQFAFASEDDRARIRGGNAKRLFRF
ncbi:MAG: amidohydrolase family protein [Bryobacteraceae bacterium]